MRRYLKKWAETLMGDRIWINRSSDMTDLVDLVARLRPRAITVPLVRVGAPRDGGYLVPDDFDGVDLLVSPGVSTEISFDLELARRGVQVVMADASVEGPPIGHANFHFRRKFVDVFEDDRNIRLDTLCGDIPLRLAGDRILQMDIEGAEYRVLLDASDEVLASFRIMAIEFHDLTQLFDRFSFGLIKATFDKLLRTHHVIHIHPNNIAEAKVRGRVAIPPLMEFTFYRKDRAMLAPERPLAFPHPLDTDTLPDWPHLALPECWRTGSVLDD